MLKYIEDAPNCAVVESDHIRGYLVHDNDKNWWRLYASAKEYYHAMLPIKLFERDHDIDDFEESVVDRWLEYGDTPIFFDKSIDVCATKTGLLAQHTDESTWFWKCNSTGSEITSTDRGFMIKALRALGEIA
jgi:hypothetical protein